MLYLNKYVFIEVFILIILHIDVPEFIFSTTSHKELRFGIDLFTQCVTTWDKDTEKNFYIARFIVLYV